MPSGRRWGLVSLGAVPAGGWQLGQDLGLAAGQSMDKVSSSDQPDVVISPSAWFVGFAFNSCFAFLTHSETLNPQLSFLAAHQSCPQIPDLLVGSVQRLSGAHRTLWLADPKIHAGNALLWACST